jgi:hypothetical protein
MVLARRAPVISGLGSTGARGDHRHSDCRCPESLRAVPQSDDTCLEFQGPAGTVQAWVLSDANFSVATIQRQTPTSSLPP